MVSTMWLIAHTREVVAAVSGTAAMGEKSSQMVSKTVKLVGFSYNPCSSQQNSTTFAKTKSVPTIKTITDTCNQVLIFNSKLLPLCNTNRRISDGKSKRSALPAQ